MNAHPTLQRAIATMDSATLYGLRRRIKANLLSEANAGPIPQSRASSYIREIGVITTAAQELRARGYFTLRVPWTQAVCEKRARRSQYPDPPSR